MNKGWSVEMVIKTRFIDQYFPDSDETTLNEIYPDNKNIFLLNEENFAFIGYP